VNDAIKFLLYHAWKWAGHVINVVLYSLLGVSCNKRCVAEKRVM